MALLFIILIQVLCTAYVESIPVQDTCTWAARLASFGPATPGACTEEDSTGSIHLLQVRAHAMQAANGTELAASSGNEDVLQLLTEAEGKLAGLMSTTNQSLSTGLSNVLAAMSSMDDILEVAQTAAQTASSILGSAGGAIVEELTKVAGEMRDEIAEAEKKVKDLSKTAVDALFSIHAAVNGTAHAVLQRFLSADEKSSALQSQPAADDSSNASTNSSSNSSLLATSTGFLKRSLAAAALLEASLADGCLTHSEVEGAIPSLAFLDVDVTDAMEHFGLIDKDADGCLTDRELRGAEELSLSAPREAISMLVERASRSGSREGKLEEAVRRKGGSPCDNAKAAIDRVNSSILDLQAQMENANATLVLLLEQAGGLASDVLSGMNETVQAGITAAQAAGLPQVTLDPVSTGSKKLLSTLDTILKSMDEAKGTVSEAVAKLLKSTAESLHGKVKELVGQVTGMCEEAPNATASG
mmetsp:Transcript_21301/g.38918  ORF Transcript_21301/g.38918 Transcript_21301/m.38918 type:complete len:472 (-) Transcript_21301:46-1461(-)